MSKLPQGWAITRLGYIVDIIRGVSYKKEDATNADGPGLVPILRATNINGNLNFEHLVWVPKKYVSDDQMLRAGDIVIAASSGSLSVVGKAAQLKQDWQG
jgi:type I restriction enzyme S subunit